MEPGLKGPGDNIADFARAVAAYVLQWSRASKGPVT